MPQLDLSWFLVNFLISWTLITLTYIITINQNWFTNNELNPINQLYNNNETNNWNW